MGGDRFSPLTVAEGEAPWEQCFQESNYESSASLRVRSSMKADDSNVNEENELAYRDVSYQLSSASLDFAAQQRRKHNAYGEILKSYEDLRVEGLEEAKNKLRGYTPGAWIEEVGGMTLSDYVVPKTTTLLVIGPKGSGKSSLINRISKVFENHAFTSARAQESYNPSVGDGTYFLQEHTIPRGSASFCLYDTRGLSNNLPENIRMIKRWMRKGVRHGELVIRNSDSSAVRGRMKCKSRHNGLVSPETRMVNFVIYVANGVSVLKSMDGDGEADKDYSQMIAATFNCPYLSFKDDKPVVVVTHGDLLTLSDRVRVRLFLAELLSIPPDKQIFDIPEGLNSATELMIVDMLHYSLEHADHNLPYKNWITDKLYTVALVMCISVLIILAIIIFSRPMHYAPRLFKAARSKVIRSKTPRASMAREWHAMRHLWLDD